MSRNSYARKAASFKISNPDTDASAAQIKSCKWLLRTRRHGVTFGNEAIEILSNSPTRADADRIIKALSKCPVIASKRVDGAVAAQEAMRTVAAMRQPNKADAAAQIRAIAAKNGIKLGKVADKHLAAIAR